MTAERCERLVCVPNGDTEHASRVWHSKAPARTCIEQKLYTFSVSRSLGFHGCIQHVSRLPNPIWIALAPKPDHTTRRTSSNRGAGWRAGVRLQTPIIHVRRATLILCLFVDWRMRGVLRSTNKLHKTPAIKTRAFVRNSI